MLLLKNDDEEGLRMTRPRAEAGFKGESLRLAMTRIEKVMV